MKDGAFCNCTQAHLYMLGFRKCFAIKVLKESLEIEMAEHNVTFN